MEPFERSPDIKLDGFTKRRRASEIVNRFMERSQRYRKPHLELARKSRELYECWSQQSRSMIQRANLKLPYAYTIVETEMPQLFEATKDRPFLKFVGRRTQSIQFESVLTDHLDEQFDEMRFLPKLASFEKNMLLDGTAVAKTPYVYKEGIVNKRVQKQDPILGQSFTDKEQQLKVLFDGPDFENIPIYDFFPDWRVKEPGEIQKMRGCVHRMWKTFQELKANRKQTDSSGNTTGIYDNLSEVELSTQIKGNDAWKPPYWDTNNTKEDFEKLDDNERNVKDKDMLEVWEYYGLFDPNNDGKFEEYIITVVNGDVVIRVEPTFYDYKIKPFVACPNVFRPNEFYGISELLAVRGLIKENQAIRNSVLDQVNLSINRMWLVDRASGIKTKSIYVRPNGILFTNSMEGIRMLEAPEIPQSALREDSQIQSDIQNATGLANTPPAVSQMSKTFGRSATGVNYIQSFAASRVGMKIALIGEFLFKPLAHNMFKINAQFITDPIWVRINDPETVQQNGGNPFTVLTPDAFQHDYDYEFVTQSDTGGSEAEIQKLQTLTALLQAAENTQPGVVNWPSLEPMIISIAKELAGRPINNLIRTPQEMMQIQQAQAAAQQAGNAAQGARAPQPNATGKMPPPSPDGVTLAPVAPMSLAGGQ